MMAYKPDTWMSFLIGGRPPFESLEKRFRLAQLVGLFLRLAPVAGLGLLDDLRKVFVAGLGELASGMAVVDPPGVPVQLFLVLE